MKSLQQFSKLYWPLIESIKGYKMLHYLDLKKVLMTS